MTKKIIDLDKNYFKCEECGLEYAEKEWAVKCETWCREHHSCNIEIIAYAARDKNGKETPSPKAEEKLLSHSLVSVIKTIFKQPLYLFVATDGALAIGLLYWWLLSKTVTWVTFYGMYWNVPLYFWPYVILTFLSMVLFGMSLAVAIYSWKHSKLRSIKDQSGNAFGTAFGALAAGCPVCGAFLLSAIGVAGGFAVLPFKGLELKLLSVGFFGATLFLSAKKLREARTCEICEVRPPELTDVTKKTDSFLSYKTLVVIFFVIFILASPLWKKEQISASVAVKNGTLLMNQINGLQNTKTKNGLYNEVIAGVLPQQGFKTRIVFGDAMVKLVQNGVIDLAKFKEIYKDRNMKDSDFAMLTASSSEPIKIDANNSGLLVNLLWPLGLANKTQFNEKSPVNGESLFNFASTGGWTLGKEKNGGAYFNKFDIVKLSPEQEAVAFEVAQNTYRPCCGNSTFFQDCNHGSALLGLIELGASQGLSKDELYKIALEFNSFWFPQNYIQTALYYKLAKNTDWADVDPKEIMGANYSTGFGWANNIARPFQEIAAKNPGLIPERQGGAGCGI